MVLVIFCLLILFFVVVRLGSRLNDIAYDISNIKNKVACISSEIDSMSDDLNKINLNDIPDNIRNIKNKVACISSEIDSMSDDLNKIRQYVKPKYEDYLDGDFLLDP